MQSGEEGREAWLGAPQPYGGANVDCSACRHALRRCEPATSRPGTRACLQAARPTSRCRPPTWATPTCCTPRAGWVGSACLRGPCVALGEHLGIVCCRGLNAQALHPPAPPHHRPPAASACPPADGPAADGGAAAAGKRPMPQLPFAAASPDPWLAMPFLPRHAMPIRPVDEPCQRNVPCNAGGGTRGRSRGDASHAADVRAPL